MTLQANDVTDRILCDDYTDVLVDFMSKTFAVISYCIIRTLVLAIYCLFSVKQNQFFCSKGLFFEKAS